MLLSPFTHVALQKCKSMLKYKKKIYIYIYILINTESMKKKESVSRYTSNWSLYHAHIPISTDFAIFVNIIRWLNKTFA
jgi:hypothetical protein